MQSTANAAMAPKYYVLKHQIIAAIEAGKFRGNEPIPSERELVEGCHVSRITVRRAIDELVHEGYLYRIQGKGTFVKQEQFSQDLLSITSCTQDVINLGMSPTREVVSAEVIPADEERRSSLELTEGDSVFRLERIYMADDTPINHTVAYLPYKTFLGIDAFDFSKASLYRTLEDEYGVRLTNATRTVEAVLAKGKIADYLGTKSGRPILFFKCITYGEVRGKRMPVETFDCYYRSDKFKFYINQVAS